MYRPPAFREDDLPTLQAAMQASGLATLVSLGANGLIATPLPLLYDPAPPPWGMLLGHVAKANPHWREAAAGAESLALFQGPDAYITPSWYAAKREHGKVVPTWNYVAIHAYGRVEFFEDAARLHALVSRLTGKFEGGRAAPWAVTDAPEPFIASQIKGIVGVAFTITRLEGKWKMSQNRPVADRAGVVAGLETEGRGEVAAVVAARNEAAKD
ncbi:MAG: FMN-binding negative transcriptional regulator [Acetobacteraceae bacterium]